MNAAVGNAQGQKEGWINLKEMQLNDDPEYVLNYIRVGLNNTNINLGSNPNDLRDFLDNDNMNAVLNVTTGTIFTNDIFSTSGDDDPNSSHSVRIRLQKRPPALTDWAAPFVIYNGSNIRQEGVFTRNSKSFFMIFIKPRSEGQPRTRGQFFGCGCNWCRKVNNYEVEVRVRNREPTPDDIPPNATVVAVLQGKRSRLPVITYGLQNENRFSYDSTTCYRNLLVANYILTKIQIMAQNPDEDGPNPEPNPEDDNYLERMS
jgi:hypothetical protein